MNDEDYWNVTRQSNINDEDYWNVTRQSGFSTDMDNSVKATSAFGEAKGMQGAAKYYSGGLSDCLEHVDKLHKHSASSFSSSCGVKDATSYGNVLQQNRKENYVAVESTPQSTVKNLFLGLDCLISQHKKLDEKLSLLDFALKTHDGDIIITVLLFLRNTLNKSLFQYEVQQRPEAMNHYVYYLEKNQELDELSHMLLMTENVNDAAILKYESSLRIKDADIRMKKLQSCMMAHFHVPLVSCLFADSVSEQVRLLEHHILIKDHTKLLELNAKFAPPLEESVISTLYYCCTYLYNIKENNYGSPLAIKTQYKLSDKQYVWTTISALAELGNWNEIENLFVNKSWLGNTKMKCCVGFNKVVPLLANAGAPPEVIKKYIELVDDINEQLNLAKKYKHHDIVMQILKNIKDKQEFIIYQGMLSPHSVEFMEIDEVLLSQSMKWKS